MEGLCSTAITVTRRKSTVRADELDAVQKRQHSLGCLGGRNFTINFMSLKIGRRVLSFSTGSEISQN